MKKSLWAPTHVNDQIPMNSGALGRIEGWDEGRPINGPVRANDHSLWSYVILKRIESWDTVRTHVNQ